MHMFACAVHSDAVAKTYGSRRFAWCQFCVSPWLCPPDDCTSFTNKQCGALCDLFYQNSGESLPSISVRARRDATAGTGSLTNWGNGGDYCSTLYPWRGVKCSNGLVVSEM